VARRSKVFSSDQRDLFQQLDSPAELASDLDINLELLGAINTAIRLAKSKGWSRDRIVERMNRLLPEPAHITLRQLNAWTALSKEYHEFPARYVPAFCAATECDLPLRALAQALQLDLVDLREQVAKRLGETLIEEAQLRRQRRDLQARLT
jgi:hypothetical protein